MTTITQPRIIGLLGRAGSGKDTTADFLVENYGYTRIAFADAIRYLIEDLGDTLGGTIGCPELRGTPMWREAWDYSKRSSEYVREMLQAIGQSVRDNISKDAWLDVVGDQLITGPDDKKWVVTDVRYKNECELVDSFEDGVGESAVWYITSDREAKMNHSSENSIEDLAWGYAKTTINNSGTMLDLEHRIDEIMGAK